MTTLIIVIFGILLIATVLSVPIFHYLRRIAREQKNFERGLKMVTLLIKIPPMSEDIDLSLIHI